MRRPGSARDFLVPLFGAALLAGVTVATLPWKDGLFRRPRTIFDRSSARAVAPGYALVVAASAVVPPKATVVVRTQPRDATAENYYYRFADALLPGRWALPAAFEQRVSPSTFYLLIVGPKPPELPGRLLLETQDGTIWLATPQK